MTRRAPNRRPAPPPRQQGRLTAWDDRKGFGFITPDGGGPRVFVHISAFPRGPRRPVPNERLDFILGRNERNQAHADQVRFLAAPAPAASRPRGLPLALAATALFFAVLIGLTIRGAAPWTVPCLYLLASVICFVQYGLDKRAARRGRWRIPESTLHLLELAGGWPGALIAQRAFRHKTRKQPFQLLFWCAAAANCAALTWLLVADAAAPLRHSLDLGGLPF